MFTTPVAAVQRHAGPTLLNSPTTTAPSADISNTYVSATPSGVNVLCAQARLAAVTIISVVMKHRILFRIGLTSSLKEVPWSRRRHRGIA
jgi:hypothetical protein